MFRKKEKKPTPVRLHKVEQTSKKDNIKEYLIQFGIVIVLILLIILFLLICSMIVPQTYGYFWF